VQQFHCSTSFFLKEQETGKLAWPVCKHPTLCSPHLLQRYLGASKTRVCSYSRGCLGEHATGDVDAGEPLDLARAKGVVLSVWDRCHKSNVGGKHQKCHACMKHTL
jgi:hypothetical protein